MPDRLTPEQRSRCMSQIRGKDTRPEVFVRSALHSRGLRFRKHVRKLPGTPDVVFRGAKLVVFIDGGFWHGYGFDEWQGKLSDFWRKKIARTMDRDRENYAALRQMGWRVLRVWDHQIRRSPDAVIDAIYCAVVDGSTCQFEV